jgi:hypothetical protein
MALIVHNKTRCPLCGEPIGEGDEVVSFPAFLVSGHRLARFSDAAFHAKCFENEEEAAAALRLYSLFRAHWEARPPIDADPGVIERWKETLAILMSGDGA